MNGRNERYEIGRNLSLINDFVAAEFVVALEATGALRYAAARPSFTTEEMAAEFRLRPELLRPALDYLCEEELFEQTGANSFRLAAPYPPLKFMANSILVNKDVIESLAPLLTGGLVYGRDIVKNDFYLKNTEGLILGAVPVLVARLKALGGAKVVDIGCGRGLGMFLRAAAEAMPALTCYGIEHDPEALRNTRDAIRVSGRDGNLSLFESDPEHPEKFPEEVMDADVLVELGLFHEYRTRQEEKIIPLLEIYKKLFPTAQFLVVEPDEAWREPNASDEKIVPLYRFVHAVCDQGFPRSKEEWQDALARAGWKVARVHELPNKLVAYECN